jgi:hypothetical protein
MRESDCSAVLTPEVREELVERGRSMVEYAHGRPVSDFEYRDNERCALVGDPVSLWLYEEQRWNGCCGSIDVAVATPWGLALYGFNHGH